MSSDKGGGPKDAFALLMSAGRKQQLASPSRSKQQQQQQKRSNSNTSTPQQAIKRQRTQSLPTQLASQVTSEPTFGSNCDQEQSQPDQQQQAQSLASPLGGGTDSSPADHAAQQRKSDPVPGSSPQEVAAAAGVTVNKQAAVAAFKRAFSGQSSSRAPAVQKFDYLLVYDLEATTNKARTLHPVEIIEVSCVIIHSATASIWASYQSFVRPTEHPYLDPFVIELCGIQQSQVDTAPLLADVLQQHHGWLQQQGVLEEGVSCIPVTWTEWDFKIALCTECGWRRIQRPDYLCRWVDLKKHFKARYKKAGNLQSCVAAAGLTWQGRAHSGIDDATNTANLAIHLMRQGWKFEVTQVSENPLVQQPQQAVPLQQGRARSDTPSAAAGAAGGGDADAGSRPADFAGSQGGGQSLAGGSQGAANRGRSSMAQKAAQKGVSGVFDASGKWLGRCFCGTKAKSRVTKRPGPNHGRKFWSCGCWTITAQQSSSCDFFLWADEVPAGGSK